MHIEWLRKFACFWRSFHRYSPQSKLEFFVAVVGVAASIKIYFRGFKIFLFHWLTHLFLPNLFKLRIFRNPQRPFIFIITSKTVTKLYDFASRQKVTTSHENEFNWPISLNLAQHITLSFIKTIGDKKVPKIHHKPV